TGFPDSRLLLFVESRVANGVVRTEAVVQSFHFPTWRFADETSLLVKDLWDPHRTFWHFRTIFLVNRSRHNYIDRFPLIVLYFLPFSLISSIHILYEGRFADAFFVLAAIEIGVAIFCAVLYLSQKWPLTTIPTISLLVVHFGLWAWVSGMWIDPMVEIHFYRENIVAGVISTTCHFGPPVLGLLASLSWGKYVRDISPQSGKNLNPV